MTETRVSAFNWVAAAATAMVVSLGATGAARAADEPADAAGLRASATIAPQGVDTRETSASPLAHVSVKPEVPAALASAGGPITDRTKITHATSDRVVKEIDGIASWYGPGFHGRRTANGERFDQNSLTAAHKSLPFNTRVRVTALSTGKSVIVTINDRGPYIRGRDIDLSAAAAGAIGLRHRGVGKVKLEILENAATAKRATGSRAIATREDAAEPPSRVTSPVSTN